MKNNSKFLATFLLCSLTTSILANDKDNKADSRSWPESLSDWASQKYEHKIQPLLKVENVPYAIAAGLAVWVLNDTCVLKNLAKPGDPEPYVIGTITMPLDITIEKIQLNAIKQNIACKAHARATINNPKMKKLILGMQIKLVTAFGGSLLWSLIK